MDGDEARHASAAARVRALSSSHHRARSTGSSLDMSSTSWEKMDATISNSAQRHRPEDHTEALNLIQHSFPPADLERFHDVAIQQVLIHVVALSLAVGILTKFNWSPGWSVLVVGCGAFGLKKRLESLKDDYSFDVERKRGKLAYEDQEAGESAEWINSMLEVIWPLISTDILKAGIDLLEDTLHAQAPSIVNSVRVDHVDQGRTSIRMLGIKVLPSDEPIAGNEPAIPDEPGDYVNIEVEFALRRAPPPAPKSSNAHFVGYFGIGLRKLASVEMPVWIQLEGLYGRLRLRLQLIAEPPFVRHTTFSFPKLPTVEIVAKPLHGLNVMSLPLISHFVTNSINIVMANFVAPASYTLDLSRILLGSDVLMRPRHTGVLAIGIHRATGLHASDIRGSSDPYVSVSFTRFAKPLFSSRIILKCLNPSWEELAFIRVSPDDIAEAEKIRMTVWDSDRMSADDPLGKTEVSLSEIVAHPGKVYSRCDDLQPYYPGYKTQGSLNWSVAFFGYHKTVPAALAAEGMVLPKKKKGDRPLFVEREEPRDDEDTSPSHRYGERMRMALDGKIPPSPDTPSGMLVIQIHQIADLEVPQIRGQVGKRKSGEALDDGSIPSSYCFVVVNDERVYETRVKKMATDPYINAGTERFIRDWTRARADIVVMDSRMREHDAIIGVIPLPLATVFANRSQVTRWWPLVGGIGYGRMRASLLFKAIAIDIERPLRGWNVGTVEIIKISIRGLTSEINGEVDVSVFSGKRIPRVTTETAAGEPMLREGSYTTDAWRMCWVPKPRLRLPVAGRMQSALSLRLRSTSSFLRRSHDGGGLVWLSTLIDNETSTVDIPLEESEEELEKLLKTTQFSMPQPQLSVYEAAKLRGKRPTLSREHSHDVKKEHKDREKGKAKEEPFVNGTDSFDPRPPIAPQISDHSSQTGTNLSPSKSSRESSRNSFADRPRIRVTLRFVPGISSAHDSLLGADSALNDVYQTWKCMVDSKERTATGGVHFEEGTNGSAKPSSSASGSRGVKALVPDSEANSGPNSWHSIHHHSGEEGEWTDSLAEDEEEGEHDGEERKKWCERKATKSKSNAMYHRGASQVKAVRTFKWMADNAKIGARKIQNKTKHRGRVPEPEKELISSF